MNCWVSLVEGLSFAAKFRAPSIHTVGCRYSSPGFRYKLLEKCLIRENLLRYLNGIKT